MRAMHACLPSGEATAHQKDDTQRARRTVNTTYDPHTLGHNIQVADSERHRS